MRLMGLWIYQNRGGELTTSEPGVDLGIRHAFLVVYQGLPLSLDVATYARMNDLHRSFSAGSLEFVKGRSEERLEGGRRRRVGLLSNHLRFHSVGVRIQLCSA